MLISLFVGLLLLPVFIHSISPLIRVAGGKAPHQLVLIRHGQSVWNEKNLFTGWHDVPLSKTGHEEAIEAGKLLKAEGLQFDVAYTSILSRAIRTLWHSLEQTDCMYIPVNCRWQLNERHYGGLQGLEKKSAVARYGADQVAIWRRSYDIPPPEVSLDSEHYPGNDVRYNNIPEAARVRCESLKDTLHRVIPLWEKEIAPTLRDGKRVVIAAHGNSLRALVKHLDGISDEEITQLDIPTAVPLVYQLDENLKPIRQPGAILPLSGRYLGDPKAILARIQGTKEQTKAN